MRSRPTAAASRGPERESHRRRVISSDEEDEDEDQDDDEELDDPEYDQDNEYDDQDAFAQESSGQRRGTSSLRDVYDEDGVRAPIAATNERLIGTALIASLSSITKTKSTSIFKPFLSVHNLFFPSIFCVSSA
jgi:hypothetical protein